MADIIWTVYLTGIITEYQWLVWQKTESQWWMQIAFRSVIWPISVAAKAVMLVKGQADG